MEVAVSAPQKHSEPFRRGTPVPLSQLVEETRRGSSIPNHLLESKLYCKLRSNSVIAADPSELHFSGFELGKTYTKILKIINISSEVMDIHIISTQTKHFKTTYMKKYRLLPGLAYTLRVKFYPDEWRYFYDCIRVHCKGDDNLLIPVHAYPVINDLHIPPHIDLSVVPLGQSVSRAIPLRCSCPIDFEFQVFVIQPHEAFSVTPLSGVIPANGEVKIVVTFRPFQYDTARVTIQLIISQFNSKPYLCTITGSSAPNLTHSHLGRQEDAMPSEYPPSAAQVPRCKTSYKSTKEGGKLKALRSLAPVSPGLKPPIDVCTHAGVAKMLIKDDNKLNPEDLKDAGVKNRKLKEAFFMKKVQQVQASQPKWQVRLGEDLMSEDRRRQIIQEREIAINKYKVKQGEVRQDKDFDVGQPKLSSERLLMEAGQVCEGPPPLQFFDSYLLERRQKGLKRFQQAARKVVIRNRMNHRLTWLKKPSLRAEETPCDFRISPERVFPFPFPVLCTKDDPLTHSNLTSLPVKTTDVAVTTRVPFFSLQTPQHYKLMGYQTVSLREAVHSYIPTTLARSLRTGDQATMPTASTESPSSKPGAQSLAKEDLKIVDDQEYKNKEEDVGARGGSSFTFTAPESLVSPFPANPIRIFNPAPGLQSYSRTPQYLECDLDFHLCPVPRYTVPEGSKCELGKQTCHAKKTLPNRQEVIQELISWSKFNPNTLKNLPNQPASSCDCALQSSGGHFTDILLTEPPPLTDCPDDLPQQVDQLSEGPRVHLTQEMIRAEFLQWKDPVFSTKLDRGTKVGHTGEPQMESDLNQMRHRVMTRLRQLHLSARSSPKPGGNL